jgi:hypothetical protein
VGLWNKPVKGNNSVQRWNNKLSTLRRHLRGWASNRNGGFKQQKAGLQASITDLDTTAEIRELAETERTLLAQSREHLTKLLREEEIKYYQRAKVKDILYGDNNTKYFQIIANGKHRKKRIFSLDDVNGKIEGQANLKEYITNFYKDLFSEPKESPFSLDDQTEDITQVIESENDLLTTPFTEEEEVKNAVFNMEHNKAPTPDGFPAEFYQKFWETIKGDLMQMFHDLYRGELPIFSLNFGVITLLPKV